MPETNETLRQIIMQKTDQWHKDNPVHLVEGGVLISTPKPNNFDKSPVFHMFMESVKEWLTQKLNLEYTNWRFEGAQRSVIKELIEELEK